MIVDVLVDDVDAVVARLPRLAPVRGSRRAPTPRRPTARSGRGAGTPSPEPSSSAIRNTNCSMLWTWKTWRLRSIVIIGMSKKPNTSPKKSARSLRCSSSSISGVKLIATWLKRGLRDGERGSECVVIGALLQETRGTIMALAARSPSCRPIAASSSRLSGIVLLLDEQVVRQPARREQLERTREAVVVVDERAGDDELVQQDAVRVELRAAPFPRRRARASRRASAARAPTPGRGRCPSTRARRRTARRRSRTASPASSSSAGSTVRAPSFSHSARRLAFGSLTTMSSTPSAFSAATDRNPIGPPPVTSQRVPGRAPPAWVMPCSATASGSVSAACLRRERVGDAQRLGGAHGLVARERALPGAAVAADASRARRTATVAVREAVLALPAARRRAADGPVADRPARRPPAPTAATVPEYSWPSITPARPPHSRRKCRSEPQIPQWLTSSSSSPGPGSGVGRSSTATSRSPMNTAAGIVVGNVGVMARRVART